MAVVEIRTDGGEVVDTIRVDDVTKPLDNGRVWGLAQASLGLLVVRRVEVAHAIELDHPAGCRTAFVEDGEEPLLVTGRDRERLDGVEVGGVFVVTDLQAAEPDELPRDQGVHVTVQDGLDSMGLNRVDLEAETREELVEYVREHWGDEDGDWFRDYVEQRVEAV